MNEKEQKLERRLEEWIGKSPEVPLIREALSSDATQVPGESTILETMRERSSFSGSREEEKIIRLESRLRRWRTAALLTSCALVALAFVIILDVGKQSETVGDGSVFLTASGVSEFEEEEAIEFSFLTDREMSADFSQTKSRLDSLSSRSSLTNRLHRF